MECQTVSANISGLIKPHTKVNSRTGSNMGRANGSADLLMIIWAFDAINMRATTLWTKNMVGANLSGNLEILMRADILMMRGRAMA